MSMAAGQFELGNEVLEVRTLYQRWTLGADAVVPVGRKHLLTSVVDRIQFVPSGQVFVLPNQEFVQPCLAFVLSYLSSDWASDLAYSSSDQASDLASDQASDLAY